MKNNEKDNLTAKLINHILEENKELKDKVKQLENELTMERLMKNINKIPQVPITPQPFEPYYDKRWWEDGPTCQITKEITCS